MAHRALHLCLEASICQHQPGPEVKSDKNQPLNMFNALRDSASAADLLRLVLMTIHDVMKLDILRPTVGCGEWGTTRPSRGEVDTQLHQIQ